METKILKQLRKGLEQGIETAHKIRCSDGLHGREVEIRNNGIKQGLRLALTMLKVIEEQTINVNI